MKRRNFVKTLASLAAVGALPAVATASALRTSVGPSDGEGPAAATPRAASGPVSLQINGTDVGFLQSFEGGNAVAEVVTTAQGAKSLGTTNIEPLRVALPFPLSAEVTKLLGETVNGAAGKHSIGVVHYDLNMKVVTSREFLNALLTEVAIEPLDASVKGGFSLLLGFQPEQVRTNDKAAATAKLATKQKTASAFRFSVSGLDGAAVTKVEMPAWKRAVVARADGRTTTISPGKIELGAASVELALSQAQPWLDWFEQFAILRKDTAERTAKLELMSADLQTVLYTVSLSAVGITALRAAKYDSNKETIAKLQASLYAERISYGS